MKKIKIAQWQKGLPEGYDISDDVENDLKEVDYAIVNAKEYKKELTENFGVFKIIKGTDADTTEMKPTELIIENLLPKDFTCIIAGSTGANKSYLAMQMGMSIANNSTDFLGFKIHQKGLNVLYADTEVGEDELIRRYKRIKRNFNQWEGSPRFNMLSKQGKFVDIWDDLNSSVNHFNPDLIIIDCLYNTSIERDYAKSHKVAVITDKLEELKTTFNCTIVAVHHFNKGGHAMGLHRDRMSGASALQNWVEHLILMSDSNEPYIRLLKIEKSRGIDFPKEYYGIEWDSKQHWLKMIGVVKEPMKFLMNGEKKEKWTIALKVMPEEFETRDWLNVVECEKGYSQRTAHNWLNEMNSIGLIEDLGYGKWKKTKMQIVEDVVE